MTIAKTAEISRCVYKEVCRSVCFWYIRKSVENGKFYACSSVRNLARHYVSSCVSWKYSNSDDKMQIRFEVSPNASTYFFPAVLARLCVCESVTRIETRTCKTGQRTNWLMTSLEPNEFHTRQSAYIWTTEVCINARFIETFEKFLDAHSHH